MPAGWTIQQITHCSASLACSDSLANHSSAAAIGEADPTTSATIGKQVGKQITATAVAGTATIGRQVGKRLTTTAVVSTATIRRQVGKAVTATVTTTATAARQLAKTLAAAPVATGASLSPAFIHPGVTNPKTLTATVASSASLVATYIHNPITTPRTLSATVTTAASLDAVKLAPVVPGVGDQGVGQLVAAVGGGVGV